MAKKKAKGNSKKVRTQPPRKLTAFQKSILKDIQKFNPGKKKLSAEAKLFWQQYKKSARKKKKPITKKARAIFNDLNKLFKQKIKGGKPKQTGFAKNNFNYIRSLLWKHHKADFKGYKDAGFLKTVNELYNDCKALGANCTDAAILERYLKLKKAPTRPQPFIDSALFDPQPYFGIKDVEFASFEPYLWIVSPMIIPAPHEFVIANYYYHYNKLLDAPPEEIEKFAAQIRNTKALSNLSKKEETTIFNLVKRPPSSWLPHERIEFLEIYAKHNEDATRGYNTFFKTWVDWCNDAMHAAYGGNPPSDKIFFKFTGAAEYNTDKERWEATLIICTAGGQLNDFGYKPTGQITDTEVWQQYVEPLPAQLQPATPAQTQDQLKEINKQKAVADVQSTLKEIEAKAKHIDKKEKEQEIRIFLLEEERKAKELARLTKLAAQLRKSLNTLNKNLKLAQKMKDTKEAKKIYAQIKKQTEALNKISDQLIKLSE